jgi:hypothetical protein
MRIDELIAWLLERGYAEEKSGYGHVSAEELATALVETFDVLGHSSTAA